MHEARNYQESLLFFKPTLIFLHFLLLSYQPLLHEMCGQNLSHSSHVQSARILGSKVKAVFGYHGRNHRTEQCPAGNL